MKPASEAMYPSLDELLAVYRRVPIPPSVQASLRERYDARGWDYVSGRTREEDGRPINACIDRDSMRDAYEELVDAVFNLLVCVLKTEGREWRPQAALAYVLGAISVLSYQPDGPTTRSGNSGPGS